MNTFLKSDKNFGILCAAYLFFLLILPVTLPFESGGKWFISDDGPLEILSLIAWPILSALFFFSPFRRSVKWPMAALFLLFMAREASWHKIFTDGGMLKLSFYTKSAAPLGVKMIAGVIAVLFFVLLLYGGFLFFRFLFTQSNWKTRTGVWLLLACAVFVVAKFFDRAPAILKEEHGIYLSPLLSYYFDTFEQGLELMTPLMLIWIAVMRKDKFSNFK